jgi:outer membrane lipoprotein-sorting protein
MNAKKAVVSMIVMLLMVLSYVYAGTVNTGAEGKQVFKKTIAALGGAEKINGIKNISYKIDVLRYSEEGKFVGSMDSKSVIEYPDKYWYSSHAVQIDKVEFDVILTVDGNEGWVYFSEKGKPRGKWQPMPEKDAKSQLTNIRREPLYISQNLDKYNIKSNGEKDFGGKKAIELLITGLYTFQLYIDPKTHLPAGCLYWEVSQADPEPVENKEIYSGYKGVDGISIPFKQTLMIKGQKWAEVTIKKVTFNTKLEKDFFKGK